MSSAHWALFVYACDQADTTARGNELDVLDAGCFIVQVICASVDQAHECPSRCQYGAGWRSKGMCYISCLLAHVCIISVVNIWSVARLSCASDKAGKLKTSSLVMATIEWTVGRQRPHTHQHA